MRWSEINNNRTPNLSKPWGNIYIYQDNWTGLPLTIRSGSGSSSDPWLIKDLEINAGGSGSCIYIRDSSDHFKFKNCTLINSGTGLADAGIKLYEADNGVLIDNNISLNKDGIIMWLCTNITLTYNNISYNSRYGINLDGTTSNKFHGNTISYNDDSGIYVGHSTDNFEIVDNQIFNNTEGIKLDMCWGGVIKENKIKNNSLYGILVSEAYESPIYIYENYFINNSVNAKEPYPYGCIYWNSSVIGNYWSNYTGSDKDDDGIGDTPFNFGTGIDYLPIWEDGDDLPGDFLLDSTADNPDPDGFFDLTWTESTGADNYSIYTHDSFITQITGSETFLGIVESFTYPISELSNGTYYYKVLAANETGTKESNCIEVIVQISSDGDDGDGGYSGGVELEGNQGFRDWATEEDLDGAGTFEDPYILENEIFDGEGIKSCLDIRNLNLYFIVKNCTFINSGSEKTHAGVKMVNVTNGAFINCTFFLNNGHGLYLNMCVQDVLFGNNISFNNYNGIYLIKSNNNTIYGNGIINNSLKGIFLKNSNNTIIKENTVSNNTEYGIYIDPSFDNVISDNFANNNDYGIFLNNSNSNYITRNYANLNEYYGIYIHSSINNSISGNFAYGNEFCGVSLENSSFSIISMNIITVNVLYGIFLNNSNYNQIVGNSISESQLAIFLNNSNNNVLSNNTLYNNEQDILTKNSEGNIFDVGSGGLTIPMIIYIIIFIIVGALSVVSISSGLLIRRSRKKIKERDVEIFNLKQLKDEITEEDIAVYKEKHFCVVHRGPIEGYTYICPDCGTYYCINCLEAIKEIENKCWSCGIILDPSKPATEIKEEADKIPVLEEESELEDLENLEELEDLEDLDTRKTKKVDDFKKKI